LVWPLEDDPTIYRGDQMLVTVLARGGFPPLLLIAQLVQTLVNDKNSGKLHG
jgi:hypothetical protein